MLENDSGCSAGSSQCRQGFAAGKGIGMNLVFEPADLEKHREVLTRFNIEYLDWADASVRDHFGLALPNLLGTPIPDYVASARDTSDSEPRPHSRLLPPTLETKTQDRVPVERPLTYKPPPSECIPGLMIVLTMRALSLFLVRIPTHYVPGFSLSSHNIRHNLGHEPVRTGTDRHGLGD